ncbi:MAG: HAMP domain-containing protein [Geminicoccaceae bacterium]|nr:MAG: HAMP domain-containing protein [Geminicoccaceae bacterium]
MGGAFRDAWRWVEGQSIAVRMVLLVAVLVSLGGGVTWLAIAANREGGPGPRLVLWLLNVNLALLLFVAFMVARRSRALWRARRAATGRSLQGRMMVMFGLIAVTPALLVSVFSLVFFNFGLDTWFNDRVQRALTNSLNVARAYLNEHKENIRADALAMAGDLSTEMPFLVANEARLGRLLDAQAALRSLTEAVVFTGDGEELARSGLTFGIDVRELSSRDVADAASGNVVILTGGNDDRVRALVRVAGFLDAYLIVGRFVDASVLGYVAETERVVGDYQAIARGRQDIRLTFTLIFTTIALLLLLTAIWAAATFADRIATPISRLALAADRIRDGDLQVRVDEGPKDEEIGTLARAFNRMTSQLAAQRHALVAANQELDERRRFTETVLGGVSAGVIGLSPEGWIILPNRSAAAFLGVGVDAMIGARLADVFPEAEGMVAHAAERPDTPVREQLDVVREGRVHTVLMRIEAQISDGRIHGYVLTFDDISALMQAQRQAAWADVARRVAHEIKNPLTPIQLSAERLGRKYAGLAGDNRAHFERCVTTISDQVEIIRRLIDEFSTFARMPTPELKEEAVVDIVKRTVELQRAGYPDIRFEVEAPPGDVRLTCDGRKLAQALTNILQNAAQAIQESGQGSGTILTAIDRDGPELAITVMDDGPGWPDKDLQRLTEPYVTSRRHGTGLGLAIVKRIMEEHGGRLLLTSGTGGGAVVTLAFPAGALDSVAA